MTWTDKTALVVDDEIFIAMDVADIVERSGASVIGPALSLSGAYALLAQANPDFALLDINVGQEKVWPLARELKNRGCRIVFISANLNHDELSSEFQDAYLLDKPVCSNAMLECLSHLMAPQAQPG